MSRPDPTDGRMKKNRISINDGALSVNCSECTGIGNLGDQNCFNCVSDGMVPGFKGTIILKGSIDRRYDGIMTEMLTEHSDILRTIRSIEHGSRDRGSISNIRMRRISSKMEKLFLSDVKNLVAAREILLRSVPDKKNNERIIQLIDEIVQRSKLLLKRLSREIST
ncbi:MAG: hypothetical protein U9R75_03925 [Candidatus Thermoplasmatota archaeon]|nr:hypothetical protein [Candidatus Thermoplasmatota archaeon]